MPSSQLLPAHRHVAHFYTTPHERDHAVADWVAPALEQGGGAVLICTPANAASIRAELAARGLTPSDLERAGRLIVVRARDMMDRFMDGNGPHRDRFGALADDLLVKVGVGARSGAPIRLWGEMVHLLWEGGNACAAHRLEILWNERLPQRGAELLCSYDVSAATPEARAALERDVTSTHGLVTA